MPVPPRFTLIDRNLIRIWIFKRQLHRNRRGTTKNGAFGKPVNWASILAGPIFNVSPNGPDQFGAFGSNTPGTKTGGIFEADAAAAAAGGGTVLYRASQGALRPSQGWYISPWVTHTSDLPGPRKPKTSGTNIGKPDVILPAGFTGLAPMPGYTPPTIGGAATCIIGTNPTSNTAYGGYGIGTLVIDASAVSTPVDGVHFTNLSRGMIGYLAIAGAGCVNGFSSDVYPQSGPTFGETGQIQVEEGIEISGHTGIGFYLTYTTQFGGGALLQAVNGGTIGMVHQSCSKICVTQFQATGYTQYGLYYDDAINTCAQNIVADATLKQATPSAWASGTTYPAGAQVSNGGYNYFSLQNGNVGNTPPAFGATNAYWAFCYDIYCLFSGANNASTGNIISNSQCLSPTGNVLSYPQGSVTSAQTRYMTLTNVIGITDQSLTLPWAQPGMISTTQKGYNHYPFRVVVYLGDTTASITNLTLNGTQLQTGSAAIIKPPIPITLNPEDYIGLSFTSTAPVWTWQAAG